MADNYLENKMAEHMAARGATRTARPARRPGFAAISFPAPRVLVAPGTHAAAAAIATELARAGCRVAMLGGAAEGVRCFPESMPAAEAATRLMHDWHEVDVTITAAPDAHTAAAAAVEQARLSLPEPLRLAAARHIAVAAAGEPDVAGAVTLRCAADTDAQTDAIARLCLCLCAPAAQALAPQSIALKC
ncbi:MAG: hypothetical protein K2L74_05265 [Muribaculaceae bacterium]|nr:hypothetical protein [Muribaculaceae bacterium]